LIRQAINPLPRIGSYFLFVIFYFLFVIFIFHHFPSVIFHLSFVIFAAQAGLGLVSQMKNGK